MEDDKTLNKKISFFENFFLFENFTKEEILSISEASSENFYKKGDIVYRQEGKTDNIFFIIKGHVAKFVRYGSNKEIIVAIKGDNSVFGELSPLAKLDCIDTAVVIDDAHILELDKSIYLDILLKHPDLLLEISGILVKYLIKCSNNKISSMNLSAEGRLAYTLTNFAYTNENDNNFIYITHDEIASTAGLARQTTSSILSKWNKENIIETKRGAFKILDLQALIDILIEAELNI